VTDTGIRFDEKGAMSHPGTDRVFKISGDKVLAVLSGNSLGGPNGLAWDSANSRWLLGGFSGKDVIRFTEDDHQTFVLASGPGGYDGLEVLPDGRVVVSSWADSSVSVVEGSAMKKLIANVAAPADIGVDTKRNRIALPRFDGNTVEIWELKPR
jgi:sugar lactone lactonase YvrE